MHMAVRDNPRMVVDSPIRTDICSTDVTTAIPPTVMPISEKSKKR